MGKALNRLLVLHANNPRTTVGGSFHENELPVTNREIVEAIIEIAHESGMIGKTQTFELPDPED